MSDSNENIKPTDNPFHPQCPCCMPETRIGSATESSYTAGHSQESIQSRARRNPTGYDGHVILKRALSKNCGKSEYLSTAMDPALGTRLTAYSRHDLPLIGDSSYQVAEENHYKEAFKRRGLHNGTRFVSGYTGFIPREQFIYGKTFQKAYEKGFVLLQESCDKDTYN